MKNYYDILGITLEATQEDVKAAYRKLSVKFHPDKNQGDKFFEEHFKLVGEAYEVLSNPEKRDYYNIKWNEFKEIDQAQDLAEELKGKERDLFKKEIDLRKKIQDVEADKIKYQQKMYHQFEKEKNELYEKFQHEKEIIKKEYKEPEPIKKNNKKYLFAAAFIFLAVCLVYAFQIINKSPEKKKEIENVSLNNKDTIEKIVKEAPKEIPKPVKIIAPSTNYSSKSPIQSNKNIVSSKAVIDNTIHQYANTVSKAELLGSDPNNGWSRDISGNYESPKVLLKIPAGQKIEILSELSKGGYYFVSYQNQKGYIHHEYLSLE